jgi:BirA family biotin operon repressor/biotin-[acetyl-CoA-carboxylase] ligase
MGALGLAVGAGLRAGLIALPGLEKLPVALKWPNDLMVGKGKLAGILCESRWQGTTPEIIVGFGINLCRRGH